MLCYYIYKLNNLNYEVDSRHLANKHPNPNRQHYIIFYKFNKNDNKDSNSIAITVVDAARLTG